MNKVDMFTFHCPTACSCKGFAKCYRLIYCIGIYFIIKINRKAQVRYVTPYLVILSFHYFIMKLIYCYWIQCSSEMLCETLSSFFVLKDFNVLLSLWCSIRLQTSLIPMHYCSLHGKALTLCGGYQPFWQMLAMLF